ncbi:hypothetical protein Trydic_g2532 [Trypoxylus dichotomus]
MRRCLKLAVVMLCVNAIISATSGTMVDITWYFNLVLGFAFVNLVCSVLLFYGISIRLHLLMLPYVFCICLNFVQCAFTFILTIQGIGMEFGKPQVYMFLGYVGLWLLIIPLQLYLTLCYLVKCLRRKTTHIRSTRVRIVVSEEFVEKQAPIRIPLKGPLANRVTIKN